MDFDFTPRTFNSLLVILKEASAARVPPGEELKNFSLATLDSALCRVKKIPGDILIRRLGARKFVLIFAPDPLILIHQVVDLLNCQEHVEEAKGLPVWWSEKLSVSSLADSSELGPQF